MDAVAVEGEGGIAEQQNRIRFSGPPPFRGWQLIRLCCSEWRYRKGAVDKVRPL